MENKKTTGATPLFFLSAVAVLAGVWGYGLHNPFISAFLVCAVAALFIHLSGHPALAAGEKDQKAVLTLLAAGAVFFALVRCFNILSWLPDFHGDEWNEIVESYYKLKGDRSFLDYSRRSGTSLPYISEAIYMLYLLLFRGGIEWLRTVPLLIFFATAAGYYLLGSELKGKRTGLIMACMYSLAGWTLFTARELMVIVYVPLFTVYLLYFFFRYINTGRAPWAAAAAVTFIGGFFTYTAWVLVVPISAAAVLIYRRRMSKEAFVNMLTFIIISSAAAAAIYFRYRNIIGWATQQTVLDKGAGLFSVFANIRQVPEFFLLPYPMSQWFTPGLPVFSFTEDLLAAGGAACLFMERKQEHARFFLWAFAISLTTLFISNGIGHHLRHIMVLPFAVILISFCLERLLSSRAALLLAAVQVALTAGVAWHMFTEWGTHITIPDTDRRVAAFVRSLPGGPPLFIHDTGNYGNYPAFLRTRSAYETPGAQGPDKAVILGISIQRMDFYRLFPGAQVQFFPNTAVDLPAVLACVVDLKGDPELKKTLIEYNDRLKEANILLWKLEYDEAFAYAGENLKESVDDPMKRFWNTGFKAAQTESSLRKKEYAAVAAILTDARYNFYRNAYQYSEMARYASEAGRYKEALVLIEKAVAAAPEVKLLRQNREILKRLYENSK